MKKQTIINLSFIFIFTSCVTSAQITELNNDINVNKDQINSVKESQNKMSTSFAKFENKYNQTLKENDELKELLKNKIPKSKVTEREILFEIMNIKRNGKTIKIELNITNKSSEMFMLYIKKRQLTITDEFGNKYNNIRYQKEYSSGAFSVDLFPEAPLKLLFFVDDYKETSKSIGVFGFGELNKMYKTMGTERFQVFMTNIKID